METKSRLIAFVSLFFISLPLFSSTFFYKVEVNLSITSTLSFAQEIDSTLKKRFINVKQDYENNDLSKSLEKSLILLDDLKKASSSPELEYLCTFLIGDLFRKLNNHKRAIEYYKNSLNLYQKEYELKDINFKHYDSKYNKSNYILSRNFLRLGNEFNRLRDSDSAIHYYNKAIRFKSLNNDLNPIKASAYTNLSGIYIRDSIYNLAASYSLKAIEIRKKTNDKLNEAAALGNLASIYLLEKKYLKAKKIYKEAIELIEFDESSTAHSYKQSFYFNLAWTLYLLKDYTAYEYQELSYDIKDSLKDQNFEHVVKGVFEKHQIELEKEKVDLAKQQLELTKAEEQRTAWFFGALALLILISSGVILYNYKLRQNNLKLKLEKTESAQKSKLEKLKSESQVRILNATLDGKEAERKKIAETLHDSVSSLLSSANLHLQATKMQFNGGTPIEVEKTQKIIIEASQTIRDLSHTLVSSVLLKFGLNYAIKDMAEKYSNSQIQINTDIKNLKRYHQGFEIKVNNIIQEFVNNILKHSNAKKAIVRIEDKDGKLIINIQDNGIGFDKELIPEKDGLGINQIDARIQMMKGVFNIDSNSENGTKIDIILPIFEKEKLIRV